jgi:hypothetical protein
MMFRSSERGRGAFFGSASVQLAAPLAETK